MKSNQELVIDKVCQLFPYEEFDQVIEILDDYGYETWHQHKEFVQLAVLKMSNGKLQRLRNYMQTARGDYRDVLLVAREPNTFRVEMLSPSSPSDEEIALAQQQDEQEYNSWLEGNHILICEHCSGVGCVSEGSYAPDPMEPSGYPMPKWVQCSCCEGTGNQLLE